MSRIFITLFAAVFCAALTFGQNIKLNGAAGSHSIGGVVNVSGNVDNSGANASADYTFTGVVYLKGTTNQYIAGNASTDGSAKITFSRLRDLAGGSTKTLKQNVDVSDTLAVGTTGSFVVGARTLTISGASSGTVLDASSASSNVTYNKSSGNQTVLPSTYAGTLGLSNAAQKDVSATVAVSGTFTHAGGPLALAATTGIVNYSGASATLDSVIVGSSAQLNNTSTGLLTVTRLGSNGGTIDASSTGTLRFTNGVTNAGTITTATGTLDFNSALSISGGGTVSVSGAGFATFAANVTNAGSFTFAAGSNATYDGAAAQTIAAATGAGYGTLTLSGAADTSIWKSAGAALTVQTDLVVSNGTLDMGSNTLSGTITTGIASAAKIAWAAGNSFVAGSGFTEFYSPSAATVAANTGYGKLIFSGSGTKTISGTVTAGPGSGLGTGVFVYNNLTVGASGDLTVNGDVDVQGSLSNSGTITAQ